MRVYAPEGTPEVHTLRLTPLPRATAQLRVGILENSKPNAGLLLSTVATELAHLVGGPPPVLTSKGRASLPADAATYTRLTHEADLVLVGSAD